MARNQPSPNGIISTAPRSLVTPVNVSCGARVSAHVGEQDVRFVLLADELDTDQLPDRAVRAVASDDVLRPDGRAVGALPP